MNISLHGFTSSSNALTISVALTSRAHDYLMTLSARANTLGEIALRF